MPNPYLLAGFVVLLTLAAVAVVVLAAGLAAWGVNEYRSRRAAEDRASAAERRQREAEAHAATVGAENRALLERLANLERLDRNELYRLSLEDLRAREVNASDSIHVAVEHLRQAARTLDVGKGKKK